LKCGHTPSKKPLEKSPFVPAHLVGVLIGSGTLLVLLLHS
jgi:hypothetical protein